MPPQNKHSKTIIHLAYNKAKRENNEALKDKAMESYEKYRDHLIDQLDLNDKAVESLIKRQTALYKEQSMALKNLGDWQKYYNQNLQGDVFKEEVNGVEKWVLQFSELVEETDSNNNVIGTEWRQNRVVIGNEAEKKIFMSQRDLYQKRINDAMDQINGNKTKKIKSYDDRLKVISGLIEDKLKEKAPLSKKIQEFSNELKEYDLLNSQDAKERLDELYIKEAELPKHQQKIISPVSAPQSQQGSIPGTQGPVPTGAVTTQPQPPVKTLDNSTTGTFNNMPVKKNSKGVWYQDTPGQTGHQSLVPKAKYGEIKDLAMLGDDMNMNQSIVQGKVSQPIKDQLKNPGGVNLKKLNGDDFMKRVAKFYDLDTV